MSGVAAALAAVVALLFGGPPAGRPPPGAGSPGSPSAGGTARPGFAVEQLKVRGQRSVLVRPRRRSNRVVILVHGASERASSAVAGERKEKIVRALLAHRYSIAASDAHGENWGDETSVRDYVALARRLRRMGLTRVYVLAESMGGLDGLLLVDRLRVVAWAGIYPVCHLRTVYRSKTKDFKREIRAAYRVHDLAGLRVAARLRMPAAPRRVRGMPMIFWASPRDRVVSKAENTDRCARAARRRGARVTVVTIHGDHGDSSAFQPGRLVRFFGAARAPSAAAR